MKKINRYWKHGELSKLAHRAGVSNSYLSDILHRRINVSVASARKFSYMAFTYTAKDIAVMEWLDSKTTRHPAFFGQPKTLVVDYE